MFGEIGDWLGTQVGDLINTAKSAGGSLIDGWVYKTQREADAKYQRVINSYNQQPTQDAPQGPSEQWVNPDRTSGFGFDTKTLALLAAGGLALFMVIKK